MGVLFIFTRRRNRTDSLHEVPSSGEPLLEIFSVF